MEFSRVDEEGKYYGGQHGILNWSRLSEQKFRVDKWSLCRG